MFGMSQTQLLIQNVSPRNPEEVEYWHHLFKEKGNQRDGFTIIKSAEFMKYDEFATVHKAGPVGFSRSVPLCVEF